MRCRCAGGPSPHSVSAARTDVEAASPPGRRPVSRGNRRSTTAPRARTTVAVAAVAVAEVVATRKPPMAGPGDPSQRLGGGQEAVGRGQVRRRHRRGDEGVEGRVDRGGRGRGQEGDGGEEPGRCRDGDAGGDTDGEEDADRRRRLEAAPVAPPIGQDPRHGGQQQVGQQPGAGRHRGPQRRSGLVVERHRQVPRSRRPAPPRRGCRTRARAGTTGCPARRGRYLANQPSPSCPGHALRRERRPNGQVRRHATTVPKPLHRPLHDACARRRRTWRSTVLACP